MTTLFLRRVGNALFADGDESISELLSLPFGKTLKAEIKQSRNVQFHRLYFALCKRIADGVGRDAEEISTVFKFATGHVDQIHSKTYGYIKIPKSISFAKLDETAFREFFNHCVQVALTEWGIEPESLADLIDPKTDIRA